MTTAYPTLPSQGKGGGPPGHLCRGARGRQGEKGQPQRDGEPLNPRAERHLCHRRRRRPDLDDALVARMEVPPVGCPDGDEAALDRLGEGAFHRLSLQGAGRLRGQRPVAREDLGDGHPDRAAERARDLHGLPLLGAAAVHRGHADPGADFLRRVRRRPPGPPGARRVRPFPDDRGTDPEPVPGLAAPVHPHLSPSCGSACCTTTGSTVPTRAGWPNGSRTPGASSRGMPGTCGGRPAGEDALVEFRGLDSDFDRGIPPQDPTAAPPCSPSITMAGPARRRRLEASLGTRPSPRTTGGAPMRSEARSAGSAGWSARAFLADTPAHFHFSEQTNTMGVLLDGRAEGAPGGGDARGPRAQAPARDSRARGNSHRRASISASTWRAPWITPAWPASTSTPSGPGEG